MLNVVHPGRLRLPHEDSSAAGDFVDQRGKVGDLED